MPDLTAPERSMTASTLDESALLARLCAGEEAAYAELLRAYSGRLMAVARRYLKNDEDVRDAVQDAFLSAFRSIGRFQGGSQLYTWLHRIQVNACLMKLRTKRRKPEESIEELLPNFDTSGHQNEPSLLWQEPAERAVERREARELVRNAIEKLPESYRTVLLLRDIEDVSTEETAELMGISPNAVKIRLHRARQALRTLIDPHFAAGA
jgi:RNA polymerase sigma-70 factor, ECF subfamily